MAGTKNDIISIQNSISGISNTLSTTNSQVNSLQTQITGTKNDVLSVQNSISGINGQINSINNVNSVQSADIATLKAQTAQNMNGAFWCMMTKNFLHSDITGYCPNLQLCCYKQSIMWTQMFVYSCYVQNDVTSYEVSLCGTFVSI
ncbi:Hypothetical_protein [Hexamita inflata]|uniref:Hypothetical_protein n=1 Tax=Hexamita inflata TaxID=28002 RepID=A0ABP1H8S6_9EUKA